MRTAIIADVHANAPALGAVLEHTGRVGADAVVCCGDIVGYSCFPHETLALLAARGVVSVHGNHDLVALAADPPANMGPNATRAILWTRTVLTSDERAMLAALPASLPVGNGRRAIAQHSRVGDPYGKLKHDADYATEWPRVRAIAPHTRVAFIGHSHIAAVIEVTPSGDVRRHAAVTRALSAESFHFVNPGSVGHPRKSDYRASFAVYDDDAHRVEFYRAAYDRARVTRANAAHGIHTDLGPGVWTYRLHALLGRNP